MKKQKSIGMILACLLMAAAMLAGCVGSYANKSTEAPTTKPAAPATDSQTQAPGASTEAPTTQPPQISGTKLEVWYAVSGTSGELFNKMSEQFAKDTGVVLELSYSGGSGDTATKVSAALLTNTQPDVALMYAGPLYTGGQDNYVMNDLINATDFAKEKEDIFPGMLSYCTYMGDKLCAMPFGISTQVMFYNKDVLKDAGVDMTNPPKTWAEFYKVLEQVAAKKGKDSAFDTTDEAWLFKSMLMQNGCEIIENNDGKIKGIFNNEKAVEVADFWSSLVKGGFMAAGEHSNAENKFLSGNLAFIAASSNRIARWSGTTTFELGAIEMPYFTQPSLALGGNVMVILTKDPEKIPACWEYIKYLTNAENNTEFALGTGYLPTHKSALEQENVKKAIGENEMYSVAFKQLDYTWAYTHFEQMGTMDVQIKSMLNKLEKGRGTPQELLDSAVKTLQKEIDDN